MAVARFCFCKNNKRTIDRTWRSRAPGPRHLIATAFSRFARQKREKLFIVGCGTAGVGADRGVGAGGVAHIQFFAEREGADSRGRLAEFIGNNRSQGVDSRLPPSLPIETLGGDWCLKRQGGDWCLKYQGRDSIWRKRLGGQKEPGERWCHIISLRFPPLPRPRSPRPAGLAPGTTSRARQEKRGPASTPRGCVLVFAILENFSKVSALAYWALAFDVATCVCRCMLTLQRVCHVACVEEDACVDAFDVAT